MPDELCWFLIGKVWTAMWHSGDGIISYTNYVIGTLLWLTGVLVKVRVKSRKISS